jgi:hypothetical protein
VTDPATPDAAVQIVAAALHSDYQPRLDAENNARTAVAALDAAGWLHNPEDRRRWHTTQIALAERAARLEAEAAPLRPVADAVGLLLDAVDFGHTITPGDRLYQEMRTLLDALPAQDKP